MTAAPERSAVAGIRAAAEEGGRFLVLTLASPPANIIDGGAIAGLRSALSAAKGNSRLRAIILTHDGPNFSYGASVPEHLPGRFEELIPAFHGLLADLVEMHLPLLAAISGHCLGAGLEIAALAHRVFATPDSHFGQPEIKLGVFAPAASAVLPLRIGQAAADDLLLSGRSVETIEAARLGLVDEVVENPAEAARSWARDHLFPKSAASLRFAVRAARTGFRSAFYAALREVEFLYLDGLMRTPDAVEGLRAFVEKRRPVWSTP